MFLVLYVDDLIICSNLQSEIDIIKDSLHTEFEMTYLGKLKYFLGINIVYKNENSLKLSQKQYLETVK